MTLAALVVANLFVVLQMLRHEWGFYEVMLVFWAEVFILGGYNVLRMIVVGVFGAEPLGAGAARWVDLGSALNRLVFTAIGVIFFVAKFGGFALAVGLFVLLLPDLLELDAEGSPTTWHGALRSAGPGFLAAAGAFGLSHGVSFVRNFLGGREFDRINVVGLVFWPYARMALVGATLLLGVAIVRLLPGVGRHALFAAVVVLVKLGADAVSHVAEHRWLAGEVTARVRHGAPNAPD
jgi:hypothetical protein